MFLTAEMAKDFGLIDKVIAKRPEEPSLKSEPVLAKVMSRPAIGPNWPRQSRHPGRRQAAFSAVCSRKHTRPKSRYR